MAVLLTACSTVPLCGALGLSGRACCQPLDDYLAATQTEMRNADQPASAHGILRVPVSIHLMECQPPHTACAADDEACQAEHAKCRGDDLVRKSWTKEILATYLGASDWSINGVWAQAGVRFDVQTVEYCSYPVTPAPSTASRKEHAGLAAVLATDAEGRVWAPATDARGEVLVPEPKHMRFELPDDQQKRVDGYLNTNVLYGIPGTVNLYFWRNLARGKDNTRPDGYGESSRRNRPEIPRRSIEALSTVWIRSGLKCPIASDCEFNSTNAELCTDCQRHLAHEFGHALGLKHNCQACDRTKCCQPTCSETRFDGVEPTTYYYYASVSTGHGLCLPGAEIGQTWCCCGCEPGSAASDGLNACGEPFVCCEASEASSKCRLMALVPDGSTLCDGEVHSARSAVREFFYDSRP